MKITLVNPGWHFSGSLFPGCRQPHLPLELGYARALLEAEGHEVVLLDGHAEGLSRAALAARVAEGAPEMVVVATAPGYLSWHNPPPELRVPGQCLRDLAGIDAVKVAIGPHGSVTPAAALAKLQADVVVMGEAEEVLVDLARRRRPEWRSLAAIAYRDNGEFRVQGAAHTGDVARLPALTWPRASIKRHRHHHQRGAANPAALAGEIEAARGSFDACGHCTIETFRRRYRARPLPLVLAELDGLAAQGVAYAYFIDEMFVPNRTLLEALAARPMRFGMRTRIDLWDRPLLDLAGAAGCVSLEAAVDSLSERGRAGLGLNCRLDSQQIAELLIHARRGIAHVQATLVAARDDPREIRAWRALLRVNGIEAGLPKPLFPYPGSLAYRRRWGLPDMRAWERADAHHRAALGEGADIQGDRLRPLTEMEAEP